MNHFFLLKSFRSIVFILCISTFLCFISTNQVFTQSVKQESKKTTKPYLQNETQDDDYISVSRNDQDRSPAYNYLGSNIFTVQVNVDGSGQNIVGDAANEPSMAVDPNDSNRIAIGWRQFDTISSSFRQAGYGFTTDGGMSWTFPGVIDPGFFRSDPVLDSDREGNFYYNSLTNDPEFMCHVFKSADGGSTWDSGTFAQGGDKQWMTIDKTDGTGEGHIYAFWSSGIGICDPEFFTRSTNNNLSYEDCVFIPGEPFWGTLAVGPEGELYVGGFSVSGPDYVVAKSLNARDSSQIVSWDTTAFVDLDGEISAFVNNSPNPGGLLGQTWIAVDTSGGDYHGNVYLLGSVNRYSNSDPLDVMFSSSSDGGINWSTPVKINDDASTSAWQWFGTMSVAPNGRIDVVWLDTRDAPGGVQSALYYSFSVDGGMTWSVNERLSDFFDPYLGWPQQQKMGDYFHMISTENGAHLAWAATFNGEEDVYYSYITADVGTGIQNSLNNQPGNFVLYQNYPNPFNPVTIIAYELPFKTDVTLKVFNMLGQKVKVLVEQEQNAGFHKVQFDGSDLPSGVYFYRLQSDGFSKTKKFTLIK